MLNRRPFHLSIQRRFQQCGTMAAIFLSAICIAACDPQEESSETALRSDQVEVLEHTAMAHSCADQYESWDGPKCEEELGSCSASSYREIDKEVNDKKKPSKPKKWLRRLWKQAMKSCRPEFRECMDQGGDKATCKEEFRACVKEFIHEHFDEMCEKLLDRCDNADPRPKACDRIEKKCEQDLNEDD